MTKIRVHLAAHTSKISRKLLKTPYESASALYRQPASSPIAHFSHCCKCSETLSVALKLCHGMNFDGSSVDFTLD